MISRMNPEESFAAIVDGLLQKPRVFSLPGRVRICLRGPDAERYLNGQLSNTVKGIPPLAPRLGCLLSAKGRVQFVVQYWKTSDGEFVLEAPLSEEEPLLARLEKYLVADDVEVSAAAAAPSWHRLGAAAADLPRGFAIDRLGLPGIDFPAPDVLENPARFGTELSTGEQEILRICHGIPSKENEFLAERFPSEAALDRRAVDFHKGCYLGQEVVSRLESVGQAKWKLIRFLCSGDTPPATGLSRWFVGADEISLDVTSVEPLPQSAGFVGLAFAPSKANLKDCVLHASQTQSSDLKIQPCEIF